MSPSQVLQPTYQRLKRAIMQGSWPQNTRLEAMRIADDYGVSVTPVRESLSLLAGEGLITARPGEGYRTAIIGIRGLLDLLSVNAVLLQSAIAHFPTGPAGQDPKDAEVDFPYADAVSDAFSQIAGRTGNGTLTEFVDRLSDRLYQVRAREHLVLRGLDEELKELVGSFRTNSNLLGDAVMRYHERRISAASELAALIF
jgi:DNA-binding transcriptional MocR family regulator